MRARRRFLPVLIFAACPAPAAAFPHVVREGENLSSIAKSMYGSPAYETVLVAANGLDVQGGSRPIAGMRLEVPSLGLHRAEPGETWYTIATRFLGDTKRADILARTNHATAWIPPVGGQAVVLPYHLTVVAGEGDTIFRLATRFYGNASRAWELNTYNGYTDASPFKRGDVILIPLVDLPLTEQALAEEREAWSKSQETGHGSRPAIEKELTALASDLSAVRYVEIVARGNRILAMSGLTTSKQSTVQRTLLEAYVALDAKGLARSTCAAWRTLEPGIVLDPVYFSPKILRACEASP